MAVITSAFPQHSSTESTPEVSFDPETSLLMIQGRSIPPDPAGFYHPIIKWLNEYIQSSPKKVNVRVRLSYFNKTTSKYLITLFHMLEEIKKNGGIVRIIWLYDSDCENDDAFEEGKIFAELVNVDFVFTPLNLHN